jgi:arabinofuranosyltransferase
MSTSTREAEGAFGAYYAPVIVALLGLYALVVLKTAWLADDAYNTFRTVDNFVHGYGLRWNVAERVQVYTHPLWMLLLVPAVAITREVYFSSLVLSIALSFTSIYLLVYKIGRAGSAVVLVLLAAVFSSAFVDYSTSGLENPLSHLLIALYCWHYLSSDENDDRKLLVLSTVLALTVITRHDLVLLLGPSLALRLWRRRQLRGLAVVAVGSAPFVAWTLFSLIYYGSPFPNTAYAKLNTGLPSWELARQGLLYLLACVERDPVTIGGVVAGVALAARARHWGFALGLVLYVVYVVRVGGCFMEGRFFTAPFFVAACLFAHSYQVKAATLSALAACIVLAGAWAGKGAPIATNAEFKRGEFRPSYINDERAIYFPHTGLMRIHHRNQEMPRDHGWAEEGKAVRGTGGVVARGAVGFYGYYAGPKMHVIDVNALGDPLLARLPMSAPQYWVIGHFDRTPLPQGYEDSIRHNKNELRDPQLHELYDHIRRVTRSRLFTWRRIKSIWFLNSGAYKGLIPANWWLLPQKADDAARAQG